MIIPRLPNLDFIIKRDYKINEKESVINENC